MIKLPKSVGEELDNYPNDFWLYVETILNGTYSDDYSMHATFCYLQCNIVSDRNQRIVNLLYAWIDGWEEE